MRAPDSSKVYPNHVTDILTEIIEGESGSLVIDQGTNDVYGQIVGSSPCGHGYVVPMNHIFAQIKSCFNVDDVRLFTSSNDPSQASILPAVEDDMESQALPPTSRESPIPEIREPLTTNDRGNTHETTRDLTALVELTPFVDSMEITPPNMQDSLWEAMVESEGGQKRFLPNSMLEVIVSKEAVCAELMELLTEEKEETIRKYADLICSDQGPSFRKIFAILVLVEAVEDIVKFIAEGVTDQDLPLTNPMDSKTVGAEIRRPNRPDDELKCFRRWRKFRRSQFLRWQWSFLAPVFSMGDEVELVKHFALSDDHILPFVKDSRYDADFKGTTDGGFGRVFKVQIHPAHHNLSQVSSARTPDFLFTNCAT